MRDRVMKAAKIIVVSWSLLMLPAFGQQDPFAEWKGYPTSYVAPVGGGPFAAEMLTDPSLPTHTIYRPKDLNKFGNGIQMPIVAFANGACANIGSLFRNFLTEIASQGFLVIAIGPPGADMSAMQMPPAPSAGGAPPKIRAVQTQSTQLIDAVNWALGQNDLAGGNLFGKLASNRIALMGQSCGGIQALKMSADPRVTTTVVLNSGLFSGPSPIPGIDVREPQLQRLHAAVAYFIGGQTDVAYAPSEHNYPLIKVPIFKANIDVGHRGTYAQTNGGIFGTVVGDWLKWQLKGDRAAESQFVGVACGLCKDPKWKIERKGFNWE